MRRAAFTLVFSLLALFPVALRAQDNGETPVFGQATCQIAPPCPVSNDAESIRNATSSVLVAANTCVQERLGLRGGDDGFFEESMGLDSSLCLTTRPRPRSQLGLTMTPKCCVVSSGTNACHVVCVKYGIK